MQRHCCVDVLSGADNSLLTTVNVLVALGSGAYSLWHSWHLFLFLMFMLDFLLLWIPVNQQDYSSTLLLRCDHALLPAHEEYVTTLKPGCPYY